MTSLEMRGDGRYYVKGTSVRAYDLGMYYLGYKTSQKKMIEDYIQDPEYIDTILNAQIECMSFVVGYERYTGPAPRWVDRRPYNIPFYGNAILNGVIQGTIIALLFIVVSLWLSEFTL